MSPAASATPGGTESAPAGAPAPLPDPSKLDTVRLKDGSLFRGTLLEHNPTGRTLLLLLDGTQRSFEAEVVAEVVAAGQAPSDSTPAPAAAAAPATQVLQDGWVGLRVHTTPGLRLFARKGGDSSFGDVCANDCVTQIPAGPYEFQLRESSGAIYESSGMFDVDQSSRIDALLTRRRAARIVGGTLLGTGLLTGAILLGRGLAKRNDAQDACAAAGNLAAPDCDDEAKKAGRGRVIGGVLTGLISTIVGAILLARHDELNVSVQPEATAVGSAPQVLYEPPAQDAPSLRPVSSGPAFEEVQKALREHQAEIRSCLGEIPASAELQITDTGAITALRVYGDLEDTQRHCVHRALQKLSFAAGAQRAVSIDIQPALR